MIYAGDRMRVLVRGSVSQAQLVVTENARCGKSWRQHPTQQLLYDHLPPITRTIQVRRIRHVGKCWSRRDELIGVILLWTSSHLGRPARTYIQQLCADTRCSPEDLPEAMGDRDGWQERVRDIRAGGRHDDDDDDGYIDIYIYIERERERFWMYKT